MGWLIAIVVILGIGLVPLVLRIRYDLAGFFVQLRIGPLAFQLFPIVKKASVKKVKSATKKQEVKTKSESGGNIRDFIPLVQTALEFLNTFRQKIRITNLKMRLTIGDPDPFDLSIKYGRGWAILGNTMPLIEQIFVIKKRDLQITCDYSAVKSTLYVSGDISILFGRLFYILLYYGTHALKQYLNIKNSKKAVQKNESKSSKYAR